MNDRREVQHLCAVRKCQMKKLFSQKLKIESNFVRSLHDLLSPLAVNVSKMNVTENRYRSHRGASAAHHVGRGMRSGCAEK